MFGCSVLTYAACNTPSGYSVYATGISAKSSNGRGLTIGNSGCTVYVDASGDNYKICISGNMCAVYSSNDSSKGRYMAYAMGRTYYFNF